MKEKTHITWKTKALDPTAGYMGSNLGQAPSGDSTINDFQDYLPFSLSSIFKIHYWAADKLIRKSEIILKPRTLVAPNNTRHGESTRMPIAAGGSRKHRTAFE